MLYKTLIINIALLIIVILKGFGQTLECGTELTEEGLKNLKDYQDSNMRSTSSDNDILYFPVQHHIVRTSSGNGGLSPSKTNDIINELNTAYKPANIQFYSCIDIN